MWGRPCARLRCNGRKQQCHDDKERNEVCLEAASDKSRTRAEESSPRCFGRRRMLHRVDYKAKLTLFRCRRNIRQRAQNGSKTAAARSRDSKSFVQTTESFNLYKALFYIIFVSNWA